MCIRDRTKDGESIVPACTCTDKCAVGKINTGCKVCRTNMSECAGKEVTEPTQQPAEPAETAPEKSANGAGLIVVVLLLLLGGGGCLLYTSLIDEETAPIVRLIFGYALNGHGPNYIDVYKRQDQRSEAWNLLHQGN